jgi:hypothetical protein
MVGISRTGELDIMAPLSKSVTANCNVETGGAKRSRFGLLGLLSLAALSCIPGAALAQTTFVKVPITFDSPLAGQSVMFNDVYAPRRINQTINGQTVMALYFGGWYRQSPPPGGPGPNDSIYRSVCTAVNSCGTAQRVINPLSIPGFGVWSQANNPTIVTIPNGGTPYLIMYMTVANLSVEGTTPETSNQIYYSTSWANDGVSWSVPHVLLTNVWLASATLDPSGNVLLYATTNTTESLANTPFLVRYNLGQGGTTLTGGGNGTLGTGVGQYQAVNTYDSSGNYRAYYNVETKYWSSLSAYEMVAQWVPTGGTNPNSEIDLLTSTDGLNFHLARSQITEAGEAPGVDPSTSCWVYYGKATQDPAGNWLRANIYLNSWC